MPLVDEVPAHWVSALRPFLQRADEFESRQPVVSYFLRTHVAFLAMKMREQKDSEGTKYLMKLLNVLEQEKKDLASQLSGIEGRTILTKFALALFSKADDEERQGNVNLNIVRLFFTASILFDATAQFTDDGQIDPFAEEKRTYARYIAVRMRKAIESGAPYQSPQTVESRKEDENEENVHVPETNVSPGHLPSGIPRTPPADDSSTIHAHAFGADDTNLSPPPYQPPSPSFAQPIPRREGSPGETWGGPAKPFAQPEVSGKERHNKPQTAYSRPSGPTPPASCAKKPSMNAMIKAQKFAKQAVSALQFYDHNNARQQLIAAIQALDKE